MTERENDTVQEEVDLDAAGDAAGRDARDVTDAVDAQVSAESDDLTTGDPESGDPESAPASEVEELREELELLNDRHLRLAAEFDNYRKRNQRDREALASRLQADLVGSLLDVLDDLQRVAEGGEEVDAEAVLEGVRLVEKKFVTVLEGAGLTPVDAEGERFDPELMEALGTVPTDDPEKDGHVADVFQRGYRLRDMLLRPARVRVYQYEETE
ncbi:MAG: nucleotide exchange factor GrpE [Longimicrobiales bacterium]